MTDKTQERLVKAMNLNNFSQSDLVRLTGISKSLISKYVTGAREPKVDKIKLLSDALNIDPIWLIGYDVPMERRIFNKNEKNSIIEKEIIVNDSSSTISIAKDELIYKVEQLDSKSFKALLDFLNKKITSEDIYYSSNLKKLIEKAKKMSDTEIAKSISFIDEFILK